jgi:hypothetical protein
LGYRFRWENAAAIYDQTITETLLLRVANNRNIKIAQKEYYTKLNYSVTGRWVLIGGFHYLYTPFNNYTYNNYIGFAGVKYARPYIHIQGLVQLGRIRDTSYQQFDAVLSLYPLGNTKLYLISRVAFGKETAFTQVMGYRILKKCWLEGNITVGKYSKLLGNDALYVYDDIDIKKWRMGGSLYLQMGKNTVLNFHYIMEQKELYERPAINYNQYSITGGVKWDF